MLRLGFKIDDVNFHYAIVCNMNYCRIRWMYYHSLCIYIYTRMIKKYIYIQWLLYFIHIYIYVYFGFYTFFKYIFTRIYLSIHYKYGVLFFVNLYSNIFFTVFYIIIAYHYYVILGLILFYPTLSSHGGNLGASWPHQFSMSKQSAVYK